MMKMKGMSGQANSFDKLTSWNTTMTHDSKQNVAAETVTHQNCPLMNRKRIMKNIAVMCVGVFTLFTAYDGPTMLQSTMNKEGGIGVAALATNYACFCISALLFPKYFIKRFGSKTTLVLSMVLYIPYIASNYYPHWAVIIPFSVLMGFGAALLWSSQATYLNDASVMLAKISILDKESNARNRDCKIRSTPSASVCDSNKNAGTETIPNKIPAINVFENYPTNNEIETSSKRLQRYSLEVSRNKVESITAQVFGIHGMAFLLSHLFGNALAYFILKRGVDAPTLSSNFTCVCGAQYCNTNSNCLANNLEDVSDKTRIILTTVCFSLVIVSVLIVALFLEPLESKSEKAPFSLHFLMATYEITKRTDLVLLIPYTLYLGQIQGFFTGEFNKAFVSCAWGTYHVSLVSISYGFFCAVFATSSGWIIKFLGRICLFTFAALLNMAFNVLLLLWQPNPLHPEVFFVSAGMIGAFVGMIWSQLRAFYGVLFKAEEEAAFGAFYVWYSIGFCLSYAYSTYFCTSVKIYVLLLTSNIGYIGYLIVEKRFSAFKSKRSNVT